MYGSVPTPVVRVVYLSERRESVRVYRAMDGVVNGSTTFVTLRLVSWRMVGIELQDGLDSINFLLLD